MNEKEKIHDPRSLSAEPRFSSRSNGITETKRKRRQTTQKLKHTRWYFSISSTNLMILFMADSCSFFFWKNHGNDETEFATALCILTLCSLGIHSHDSPLKFRGDFVSQLTVSLSSPLNKHSSNPQNSYLFLLITFTTLLGVTTK